MLASPLLHAAQVLAKLRKAAYVDGRTRSQMLSDVFTYRQKRNRQ